VKPKRRVCRKGKTEGLITERREGPEKDLGRKTWGNHQLVPSKRGSARGEKERTVTPKEVFGKQESQKFSGEGPKKRRKFKRAD